jgi:hypothetical protein
MTTHFPPADYYTCDDPEQLTHTEPEDAIERHLDKCAESGCDMLKVIEEHSPLTVECYMRSSISELDIKAKAESLAEQAHDDWADEYGGPDCNELDVAEVSMFAKAIAPHLDRLYRSGQVWNCERFGAVQLNRKEVEELMREHRPDWFKAAP